MTLALIAFIAVLLLVYIISTVDDTLRERSPWERVKACIGAVFFAVAAFMVAGFGAL